MMTIREMVVELEAARLDFEDEYQAGIYSATTENRWEALRVRRSAQAAINALRVLDEATNRCTQAWLDA